MDKYSEERKKMVKNQLIKRGINDKKVLDAFKEVPRHKFVPEKVRKYSYQDGPLPIGKEQTISQPYIVAEMVQALNLDQESTVLEVGTGFGYAAAILSRIAQQVYTIERIKKLADKAKEIFKDLNYNNIKVNIGDGSMGWPESEIKFDGIIVSAAAPSVPESYIKQLKTKGNIVIPVGNKTSQNLYKIQKTSNDSLKKQSLGHVRFVPLIGEGAFKRR